MHQLLEARPDVDVAVLAVWVNLSGSDSRSSWDPSLLEDDRVEHLWDDGARIAGWYAKREGAYGPVYDVYYLYGPDGSFSALKPTLEGRPVVYRTAPLAAALR